MSGGQFDCGCCLRVSYDATPWAHRIVRVDQLIRGIKAFQPHLCFITALFLSLALHAKSALAPPHTPTRYLPSAGKLKVDGVQSWAVALKANGVQVARAAKSKVGNGGVGKGSVGKAPGVGKGGVVKGKTRAMKRPNKDFVAFESISFSSLHVRCTFAASPRGPSVRVVSQTKSRKSHTLGFKFTIAFTHWPALHSKLADAEHAAHLPSST